MQLRKETETRANNKHRIAQDTTQIDRTCKQGCNSRSNTKTGLLSLAIGNELTTDPKSATSSTFTADGIIVCLRS